MITFRGSSGSRMGQCFTEAECASLGGKSAGACAAG